MTGPHCVPVRWGLPLGPPRSIRYPSHPRETPIPGRVGDAGGSFGVTLDCSTVLSGRRVRPTVPESHQSPTYFPAGRMSQVSGVRSAPTPTRGSHPLRVVEVFADVAEVQWPHPSSCPVRPVVP